jgi:putative membrane-bound dehydrogenase-like protein
MVVQRMKLTSLLGVLGASLLGAAPFPEPTNNQAETIPLLSPEVALSKMQLPPGFKATVFAAEPELRQPIALCWDERGRLWVAENYTYSDKKERFDLSLRDRILIFEDEHHTGKFSKRTVFTEDLQMLTSIERGLGGVFALCPPNLLFIPLKGDQPAGPPVVLLDGFSTTAASRHTFANGLKWGPDGWLYGRIGISSTSWIDVPSVPKEKRQPTAGGLWRYHPIKKIFEPYCHGTTNPWGSDWTKDQELIFINTVIGHAWQGIYGAHFKRMHGEDPYEGVYELIDQHADHYHWDTGQKWTDSRGGTGAHDALGGGHAHVGMMIYQGDNWPAEYRDKLFTLNLHGRRANLEKIDHAGSAIVVKHVGDLLRTEDLWFRGIEISQAPDGGVVMLDWSDIGECHEEDGVHRTSGRIYKVTYGDPAAPPPDLRQASLTQLVEWQRSTNQWLVRMARWELRERAWHGDDMKAAWEAWTTLPKDGSVEATLNAQATARALLAAPQAKVPETYLNSFGPLALRRETRDGVLARLVERELIEPLVVCHQAQRRGQATETMLAEAGVAEEVLVQLAGEEHGPQTRLALAEALTQLGPETRSLVAQYLVRYDGDEADHNLPLMIWYGIRDLPAHELLNIAHVCRLAHVTKLLARRLAEGAVKQPEALDALLELTLEQSVGQEAVLLGLSDGLKGVRQVPTPAHWSAFVASLAKDEKTQSLVQRLGVVFGSGQALTELRQVALAEDLPIDQRRKALRALIEADSPELRADCEKLLGVNGLSLEAMAGLVKFDDPALAQKIIRRYPGLYPHERSQAILVLCARPSFARVLVDHLLSSQPLIKPQDVGPLAQRQLRAITDVSMAAKVTQLWGQARESSADKLALMAALTTTHTPESLAAGDLAQGHQLFLAICGQCHRLFGEGAYLGPDLTGSGRHDLHYLLENIVDPSAVVAPAYLLTTFNLKDGRVISGLIAETLPQALVVRSVGQEWTLQRSDIVRQTTQPLSLMPEGLLQALTPTQQRDLLHYLMSDQPGLSGK